MQKHNLNKLGKSSYDDPTYQIDPVVSDMNICLISLYMYVKHVTPGQGHFWPLGLNFVWGAYLPAFYTFLS